MCLFYHAQPSGFICAFLEGRASYPASVPKLSCTVAMPCHQDLIWTGSRGDHGKLPGTGIIFSFSGGLHWAPVVRLQLEELSWCVKRVSIPFISINGGYTLEYHHIWYYNNNINLLTMLQRAHIWTFIPFSLHVWSGTTGIHCICLCV